MTLRSLTLIATLGVAACATTTDTTDATDTGDSAPTDTEVEDLDSSKWVVDTSKPQVFKGTLVVGDKEQPGDFTDVVAHSTLVTKEGDVTRNFFGRVEIDNPGDKGPEKVSFELRIITPEDELSEGDHTCLGTDTGGYGVAVGLLGPNDVPVTTYTTLYKAEVGDACTIKVTTGKLRRFVATIDRVTLRSFDGERKAEVKDIEVDLKLGKLAE